MPNFDKTGPKGKGQNTGRGLGNCDTPAGGTGRGLGRGTGRGTGRGRRRMESYEIQYYENAYLTDGVREAIDEIGIKTSEDLENVIGFGFCIDDEDPIANSKITYRLIVSVEKI